VYHLSCSRIDVCWVICQQEVYRSGVVEKHLVFSGARSLVLGNRFTCRSGNSTLLSKMACQECLSLELSTLLPLPGASGFRNDFLKPLVSAICVHCALYIVESAHVATSITSGLHIYKKRVICVGYQVISCNHQNLLGARDDKEQAGFKSRVAGWRAIHFALLGDFSPLAMDLSGTVQSQST
jgi:hypothetical protein